MGVLFPLPAGFVTLKREIECTSRGECCSPSSPLGKEQSSNMGVLYPLPAGFVVLGNARSKFSRTQAGFTDEVPRHGNIVPPPSLRAFLPHSE